MSNPNEQTNLVLVQAVKCASCPAMAVYRCHECEKTVCVRHMREVEQREGRVVYTRSFCTECAPKVESRKCMWTVFTIIFFVVVVGTALIWTQHRKIFCMLGYTEYCY